MQISASGGGSSSSLLFQLHITRNRDASGQVNLAAKRTEICPELTLLWAKGDAALDTDH